MALPDPLRHLAPRLPTWVASEELRVEPLPGGWTNENYRIESSGEAFVLRIAGAHASALGVDRENEQVNARRASELGLAPELICFLLPEGHMVTRFVHGRSFPWDRTPARGDAFRMLEVLRRVHALPAVAASYSPFDAVTGFWRATRDRGGVLPKDLPEFTAQLERIRARQGEHPPARRLCHNDLSLGNFVAGDDGRMVLLDWEYAAMGDPFFDLATLSAGHTHDRAMAMDLLDAYLGGADDADRTHLCEMELLYELREASWSELLFTLIGGWGPLAAELRDASDRFFEAARSRRRGR